VFHCVSYAFAGKLPAVILNQLFKIIDINCCCEKWPLICNGSSHGGLNPHSAAESLPSPGFSHGRILWITREGRKGEAMEKAMEARVLLVDDEEDFLETLSSRLELRGLKVSAVTSGEQAVSEAKQQEYDAIVVDLSMPGIDGLETLKRIKADNPNAEIIMLTGQASVQSGVEAMKLGAGDFLQKPVELSELMAKIGEAKSKKMLVLQKQSQEEVRKILQSKSW
jgi:CheY-like chemotaxis protein